MTNSNNYLAHYGVIGMKWGVRKKKIASPRQQRRIQQKQNYKLVKSRLKKAGVNSSKLQNYERGGVSQRKVKKILGSDIKISQVNDYIKHKNKRANQALIASAAIGMGAVLAWNKLHS